MILLNNAVGFFKEYRIKKNDTKITINNIERFNMNENLETKKYINTLLDFVEECKKIFGDGFQLMDTVSTIALSPKIYTLATDYMRVKEEFLKLSAKQIEEITTELGQKGISIFYTDNGLNKKELGIENLGKFLDELFVILKSSIDAAKNGIDMTDLVYVFPITTSLTKIVICGSDAFEEVKHLDALEVAQIVGILIGKTITFIRN